LKKKKGWECIENGLWIEVGVGVSYADTIYRKRTLNGDKDDDDDVLVLKKIKLY